MNAEHHQILPEWSSFTYFNQSAIAKDVCGLIFHKYLHSQLTNYTNESLSFTVLSRMFSSRWSASLCKAQWFSSHGWKEPSLGYQTEKGFLKGAKATKMNSKALLTTQHYDSPYSFGGKDHQGGHLDESPNLRALNDLKVYISEFP